MFLFLSFIVALIALYYLGVMTDAYNPDTTYFIALLEHVPLMRVSLTFPRPHYIALAFWMPSSHVVIHAKDFSFGWRTASLSRNNNLANQFFPVLAGDLLKTFFFDNITTHTFIQRII